MAPVVNQSKSRKSASGSNRSSVNTTGAAVGADDHEPRLSASANGELLRRFRSESELDLRWRASADGDWATVGPLPAAAILAPRPLGPVANRARAGCTCRLISPASKWSAIGDGGSGDDASTPGASRLMTVVQMRQRRLTASFLAPHPGHFTFDPMRSDVGESDDGLESR